MRKFRVFLGYLTLILIAVSMLYPFFAMVRLSCAGNNEIFSNTGYGFTFANYNLKRGREELPYVQGAAAAWAQEG